MATIKKFEDLEVWQKARSLCQEIFGITNQGTFVKDISLRRQINRSSGSIMDNIAEGFERGGNKEFIQFLFIAKASAAETRSQLYRALDRKHISQHKFNELYELSNQIGKMIMSFINYLKKTDIKGRKFK